MSSLRVVTALGLAALTVVGTVAGSASAATAGPAAPDHRGAPNHVVGAYFAGWESGDFPVSKIPADTVTNVFYAFSTIADGACTVPSGAAGDFAALKQLKASHPNLKVSISIGGWGAGGFSDAALTDASRKKVVGACLNTFFRGYPGVFDGVDIDWEFPVSGGPAEIPARPADKQNATLLAKEFRKELDQLGGGHKLLTAALPAGRLQTGKGKYGDPYDPANSFDLGGIAKVLDWINLMTYDMGTGFSPVSTFNAPMAQVPSDPLGQPMKRWNNVTGAVQYYEQHGVPADRIVLGVPFYGRGFHVTQAGPNHGLFQPWDTSFDPGSWGDIKAKLLTDPAWEQHWDDNAQAPWLYNAAEQKFVSFENPRSIGIRSGYARAAGLRGAFMWEIAEDDSAHSMLNAMAKPW
ncbi:glycoside hydrolase family 18 protein [Kutzneria sp. CA-103260]|uniref:glycoside hydrolase family 18 protein n=1 Tax=Kutzneria sp. CA-103260 TaxID=2802641 RepID=UPI001BADA22F|nr:glycoside hydrolase family 18 protein [Kutzneria sp. CA-103260]QUQ66564.1 Glycosyl hydrolases family 18 [Kutzneria sp. CA-103260]